MSGLLRRSAAGLYGVAWEARRQAYALGLARARRVGARVVSVGNLSVGGTGKTTLVLHLAQRAMTRGMDVAVVCRRYRPGPDGRGDEERLHAAALGEARVYAGARKRAEAERAAAAGARLVIVDDGFSHWGLARDLDVVLLDSRDLWGGGALLPAGRLREPRRALQRAGAVVVSRLGPGQDPAALLAEARRYAPAVLLAAGRHRVAGTRGLDGAPRPAGGRARIVTATGSPAAVAASAREAGFTVTGLAAFRDHHWFDPREARRELEQAAREQAVLLLTAKDAVRWPAAAQAANVAVLVVEWEWVVGGTEVERLVFAGGGALEQS